MTRYRLTPQAFDNLFDIWSYIAQDSPADAERVEEMIYLACERLALATDWNCPQGADRASCAFLASDTIP